LVHRPIKSFNKQQQQPCCWNNKHSDHGKHERDLIHRITFRSTASMMQLKKAADALPLLPMHRLSAARLELGEERAARIKVGSRR
jgi:hypothetical protein